MCHNTSALLQIDNLQSLCHVIYNTSKILNEWLGGRRHAEGTTQGKAQERLVAVKRVMNIGWCDRSGEYFAQHDPP